MRYLMLVVIGLSLAVTPLLAQDFGGGMFAGGAGGGSNVVGTSQGLFVLRNGVLAKYDLANLKAPQVFELFGPAPTMPADATDRTAVQAYMTDMQRRTAPGLLLAHDASLLVIVGNGFARISQSTLDVEATADLTPPADAATTAAATQGRRMPDSVTAQLQGENLYLIRSREVVALNVKTGAILSRVALPEEMQPRSFGAPGGGGGGNRGGGYVGGHRGNADGGTPAPAPAPQ